ncbi:MAG: hypothetical protein KTR16_00885 [Acidiferrobacterales bacterium]|nr:hypothetical protein [Acidiferrobacterales bacterium]
MRKNKIESDDQKLPIGTSIHLQNRLRQSPSSTAISEAGLSDVYIIRTASSLNPIGLVL